MKISVITVVYNGEAWIENCIQSVLGQDYPYVEYIVIDGGSKDRTMEIVNHHKDRIAVVVSEKDKGLYDAMNKGIALATGEVVGILNADDMYASPHALTIVAQTFSDEKTDMVWGDLVVVNAENTEKVMRYCTAGEFKRKDFEKGDMPPHPAVFVRRSLYEKFGNFDLSLRIAGDFDWMLRTVYKGGATWSCPGKIIVKMRTGGLSQSGFGSKVKLNREIKAACEKNGVKTSTLKIYSKYLSKLFQLIRRPGK